MLLDAPARFKFIRSHRPNLLTGIVAAGQDIWQDPLVSSQLKHFPARSHTWNHALLAGV